eukprot:8280704-Prorocentrum_lima.AAC.1
METPVVTDPRLYSEEAVARKAVLKSTGHQKSMLVFGGESSNLHAWKPSENQCVSSPSPCPSTCDGILSTGEAHRA